MVTGRAEFILKRLRTIAIGPPPSPPPKKQFSPKCPELPTLKHYEFGAPKKFWDKFPSNRDWKATGPYKLDGEQILRRAINANVQNMTVVNQVVQHIKEGCDLRVRPSYTTRMSSNAPSAREEGDRVTDELAVWIKKGIVVGPFEKSEIPEDATVSGLMCKIKPTGAARIIVNQSSPKTVSINDNVDKDAYPCSMEGTKEWIRALNFCGNGALMMKLDWNAGRFCINLYQIPCVQHISIITNDFTLFMWILI